MYLRSFLSILLLLTTINFALGKNHTNNLSYKSLQNYNIALYNDSSIIQQYAAKELRHYLKLIFNVDIHIVKKETLIKEKKYFFLGEGFVIDSLGIDTLSKDAFVKAFSNGNFYFGGIDDLDAKSIRKNFLTKAEKSNFSTLYAVYDFLENDIGVHWFFPTLQGEHVPIKANYLLKEEFVAVSKPAFIERNFSKKLYYNLDTLITWMLRNKVGFKRGGLIYQHSWDKLLPYNNFHNSSPSIFAHNGSKILSHKKNNRDIAQLCTSNPLTIKLFVKQALEYINKNNLNSVSLSPNDGRYFCNCSNCNALDTVSKISPKYSRLSNRIFSFYREVNDSLKKHHPNIKTGGYAYKEYSVLTNENILPNDFHIRLAINNIGFGNNSCSSYDTLTMIISSWEKHIDKGFYSFPYGNTWVYPILRTNLYKNLITELYRNGFDKMITSFYPDWYNQGLDIWLISKLLWNPDIDTDSLKNIYYKSVFPQSSEIIRTFHTELEKKADNLSVCVPNFNLPGKNRTKKIFLELFDDNILETTLRKLRQQTGQQLTDKELKNIKNFILLIEFLKIERKAYSMNALEKFLTYDSAKKNNRNKIELLKNSLIISNYSKYWDTEKSPSFFLQ